MRNFLASISLSACLLAPLAARAQTFYPESDGQQVTAAAMIELPKGSISGICALSREGNTIHGAIVNEFGITAIGFSYDIKKDKVRISHAAAMLSKWYVRKLIANNLRELIHALREGKASYADRKHGITFSLSPLTAGETIGFGGQNHTFCDPKPYLLQAKR